MFNDDMLFMTCPKCRIPSTEDSGGCHWWRGIQDPKINETCLGAKIIK